ncbi:MAG: hypothetical protein ACK5AO_04530 [bacterium]|jgi:hypothetical protein
MFKKYLFILVSTIYTVTVWGQSESSDYYDIRLKKLLDSEKINYTINKNNNFRINVITEEEPNERTQIVLMYSRTTTYSDFEIREITSAGLKIKKKDIKNSVLFSLLVQNGDLKIGSWEIQEYNDDDENILIAFSIKVSTNIPAKNLVSLMHLVANEADRVEKLYGSGADDF